MVCTAPFAFSGIVLSLVAGVAAQAEAAPARPVAPGLAVTFAPLDPAQRERDGAHSERVRLLALCVERGETPTPWIAPGMFEATFRGLLPLAVRDRHHFRVEGRGSFELSINGERVLDGTLRPGRTVDTEQPVRLKKGDNLVALRLESTAVGEAQLRLSWSSSAFAFEPVPPTAWRWPVDDPDLLLAAERRRGHQLLVDRHCVQCHRLPAPAASAYDELDQRGPDLRLVGQRLRPAFLLEWLRDPRAVRVDATMPRPAVESEQQLRDLAAWLATLGQPLDTPPLPAAARARGAERFAELGCIACHLPPDAAVPPLQPRGRMPLAFVARKWHAAALVDYLLDPARDQRHTRMPDFRLGRDDAQDLAAYLLATAPATDPAPTGDADAGRRLAARHGCDRCHELSLPDGGDRFRELPALHADHGCLAATGSAARGVAPDHGLSADDLAALRAFLPHAATVTARRSPIDFAARMLEALRCTHCHGMDGRASVWSQVVAAGAATAPVPPEQDPVLQGVPALTWVGSKLQPGWMERFVTGNGSSPRPWLHARMPAFAAHGAAITTGLVRAHGYPSADEPEAPADAQLAAFGARLVRLGDGFGCVQCHGKAGQPPLQVFDRQGIDFAVTAARLRRDYYLRWLLDPLRIDPDSRMPKYADDKGRTALEEVLDGDARRQFEAIWHWFRTLK